MSALLDYSTGQAAFARQDGTAVAWHGEGQVVKGNDRAEWLKASGLDWDAVKTPMYYGEGRTTDKFALVRNDTDSLLGIVSKHYKTVQPHEIIDTLEPFVNQLGYNIDTAGALKGGKVVYVAAKTSEMVIGDNDTLQRYLLLNTSFDGTSATEARLTTTRVVCNNTLSAARLDAAAFSRRHNQKYAAEDMQAVFGVQKANTSAWETFEVAANKLANERVAASVVSDFFRTLLATEFSVADLATDAGRTALDKRMERLEWAYRNAPGHDLSSADGTMWGAVNAVTYDVDHWKREGGRGRRASEDAVLFSKMLGDGAEFKELAFATAVAYAG